MADPLLSIVIASYNSAKHIEACLASLRREYDDRVELLLIDGASADETMEIAKSYSDLFAVMLSEPDDGQSDAFNKGFRRATGKYMTWLNSDDVLCQGSLSKALEFIEHTKADWLAANSIYIDNDGNIMRCCRSGGFEAFAPKFGLLNVFGPSTFFSRRLYEEVGPFRTDFHFCMDTEYWWRIAASGVIYERMPCYFWALRLHDDAKTASAITGEFNRRPKRMQEEGALIRQMYYPQQSPMKKKLGVLLVRAYRVLNGSYLHALWDTFRWRGRGYKSLDA